MSRTAVRNVDTPTVVVPIGTATQARRRRLVRRHLVAAGAAIDAGLAGDIALEQAVTEAHGHLIPAVREVLKRALA